MASPHVDLGVGAGAAVEALHVAYGFSTPRSKSARADEVVLRPRSLVYLVVDVVGRRHVAEPDPPHPEGDRRRGRVRVNVTSCFGLTGSLKTLLSTPSLFEDEARRDPHRAQRDRARGHALLGLAGPGRARRQQEDGTGKQDGGRKQACAHEARGAPVRRMIPS